MKLKTILLGSLLTLSFSTALHAETFKLKMCERAESALYDTVNNTYNEADHSFVASLDASNQEAYFNLAKGKLEMSIAEVRKRCKHMDEDVLHAYEQKKSEIEEQLGKVRDL